MNCFHCGNRLSKNDICLTCGQDVRLFKKIVAASWRYYDEALKKAHTRDLSGAIDDLKNSLLLYKKNTEARNLLGLIYYEMGDTAEALVQWVVSDNLNPDDHHAAQLLSKVQSDQVELQRGNLTIRKYNQALRYVNGGSEDLAILQLNKVLSVSPHMIKANLLMALLQLQAGQPDKAERYIREVLKVDRTNATALRYEGELHTKEAKEARRAAAKEKEKITVSKDAQVRRHLSGDDVIIPTYKESKIGLQTVLEVLAGLVLGAALVAYLIMPSRISSLKSDFNQTISSYNERLSAREAIIASGEAEIEALNERIAKLEENVQSAHDGVTEVLQEYNKLLRTYRACYENEYLQGANLYLEVDASVVSDREFQEMYQVLKDEFTQNGYTVLVQAGRAQYDRRNYEGSVEYFQTCLKLAPEEETLEARFWMGLAYINMGDRDTADSWFESIITIAPEDHYAELAAQYKR
jgi:tetratricopeptide (TPR) repeat protein